MKKRLLALFLALTMCLALLPTAALAADSDFTIENGVLTKYNGSGGDVVIPDGVTSIGFAAFEGCTSLTSVAIPHSVTSIGVLAFQNCNSLTSVTIPSSVTDIGENAFRDCTGLTSVTILGNVTSIGYLAFDGTPWLKNMGNFAIVHGSLLAYQGNEANVIIPNSVTSIGDGAFSRCGTSLTSVTIPNSVTSIGDYAFGNCTGLTSVTIPSSVTSIGPSAFADTPWQKGQGEFVVVNAILLTYQGSNNSNVIIPNSVATIGISAFLGHTDLTSVIIPNSVTSIENGAFYYCPSLASVTIPDSVTNIEGAAFSTCISLTDVYYSGSETQWNAITIEGDNDDLTSATIHYNSSGPEPEYIYDTPDPAGDLVLPAEKLENVETQAEAVKAVKDLTASMTQTQKEAPTGIDLATLYAETAAAKVSTKKVTESELLINAAAIKDLQDIAQKTTEAVESALVSGGVTTARYLAKTATFSTSATGKITFRVDPDVLTVDVDKIRVETPDYAITLDLDELEPDLTGVLTFTAEAKEDTSAVNQATADAGVYAAVYKNTAVEVGLPNGQTTNPVNLSLPTDSGDQTYKAVVKTTGETTTSKYNPATTNIDGKISSSGTYKVTTNEVNFTDISGKTAEMQEAIRTLASKAIITGTSATTFSPDNSINRAEIAALLVRTLGWNSSAAVAGFTDVTPGDWFYSAAASSQAHNLINGFEDGTFKGRTNIAKDQLIVVSSRVLKEKMGYQEPADTAYYLANYTDSVAVWAQGGVALATRENLVVPRVDRTFKGANTMTRGDAAIIIYRLFQRIW